MIVLLMPRQLGCEVVHSHKNTKIQSKILSIHCGETILHFRSNSFSASSQLSIRWYLVSFKLCGEENIIALPSKTDKLKSWSSISISPFKTLLSPQNILRFQ